MLIRQIHFGLNAGLIRFSGGRWSTTCCRAKVPPKWRCARASARCAAGRFRRESADLKILNLEKARVSCFISFFFEINLAASNSSLNKFSQIRLSWFLGEIRSLAYANRPAGESIGELNCRCKDAKKWKDDAPRGAGVFEFLCSRNSSGLHGRHGNYPKESLASGTSHSIGPWALATGRNPQDSLQTRACSPARPVGGRSDAGRPVGDLKSMKVCCTFHAWTLGLCSLWSF